MQLKFSFSLSSGGGEGREGSGGGEKHPAPMRSAPVVSANCMPRVRISQEWLLLSFVAFLTGLQEMILGDAVDFLTKCSSVHLFSFSGSISAVFL